MQTLDNLTPAQLRDLATRATNAAAAQEKAAQKEIEAKRLADEAKKKAEIVFEHGEYALLQDGTLQYQSRTPSCFNTVTVKDLLGRIRRAGGGYDKVVAFLAAYEAHEADKSGKKQRQRMMDDCGLRNIWGGSYGIGSIR